MFKHSSKILLLILFCLSAGLPTTVFAQDLMEQVEADYNQVARTQTMTISHLEPEAVKAKIEALQAQELTAPVAFQLGKLHFESRQIPKALTYFEQVADLAESEDMQRIARLFVAKLYGMVKDEEAALAHIELAKQQWPDDPTIYLHEGEVFTKMKQWDKAKAAYARGMTMADDAYVPDEKLLSYHVGYALAIGKTDGTTAGLAYAEEHVKPQSTRFYKYILHSLGVSEEEAAHTAKTSVAHAPSAEIYPNPATDQVKLSWGDGNTFRYSVMNTSGQLVMAGEASDTAAELDVSRLSPGVYQVVLKRDGAQHATQFVKQ